MNTFDTLKLLTVVNGVAGDEQSAAAIALELLKEYTHDIHIDKHGSVIGRLNSGGVRDNGKPTLLIDAHIDEVGLIVTYIDDAGFVKAEPCGGADRRMLPGQSVTIHGKQPVKGVICSPVPHVKTDKESTLKADEIYIDTGYNKQEVSELVELSSRVVVNGELTQLLGDKVCSRALDDRAGVAAILYALSLLKNTNTNFNITVVFSVQEEVGCRGARVSAYNADADYAIAVDVSYGASPGCKEYKCGKLSSGPMIGIAPSLNREMSDGLIKTAQEWEIPYQLEIMNRDTGGTNADVISLVKGGVKTALVSIPLKYMHMPVETASIADIEAAGQLIAAFIEGYEPI